MSRIALFRHGDAVSYQLHQHFRVFSDFIFYCTAQGCVEKFLVGIKLFIGHARIEHIAGIHESVPRHARVQEVVFKHIIAYVAQVFFR